MKTLKEYNVGGYYTAEQLRTMPKFKGKYLRVGVKMVDYEHPQLLLYHVAGVSKTIRENYETVEEILE